MSKHTPGPWTADHYENGRGEYTGSRIRCTGGGDWIKICDVQKSMGMLHGAEEVACNARLIAAAPEMLAALKLIAKHFQAPELRKVTSQDSKGRPSTVSIEMIMGTVEQIAAAIAKAEGRS